MKQTSLRLQIATALSAFFVTCLCFGQSTPAAKAFTPTKPSQEQRPLMADVTTGAKKKKDKPGIDEVKSLPVLIDLKKIDFDKMKRDPEIEKAVNMGPGSGGGGNSCALMIKQNIKILFNLLDDRPGFKHTLLLMAMKQNLRDVKFALGTDLYIDDKKVDAINYPNEKFILVEDTFCKKLESFTPASMGILLHEILGVCGIKDTFFEISGEFLNAIYKPDFEIKATEVEKKMISDLYEVNLRSLQDSHDMLSQNTDLYMCRATAGRGHSPFVSMGRTMEAAIQKIQASCSASQQYIGFMKDLCTPNDLAGKIFCYKFQRAP